MVGYGFIGFSLARPLGELAAKPTERVGFADGAGLVEWGGFPSPQSPMATVPLEYKRSLWWWAVVCGLSGDWWKRLENGIGVRAKSFTSYLQIRDGNLV